MRNIVRRSMQLILFLLFFILTGFTYFHYKYDAPFNYEVINFENRSGIHLINNAPAIRAFFITNRTFEQSPPAEFKDTNARKLTYGITFVEIPKQYRMEEYFDDSKVHLHLYNKNDFIVQLKKSINKSPSKRLIIWVHGFRSNFNKAAALLSRGAYDLNTEATYLFFSWPSKNSLLFYEQDELMEKESAPLLAQFLIQIHQKIPKAKLMLISHSLGARLICDAFDVLDQQDSWKDKNTEIQEVIMIAPDVNAQDFDFRFKQQILTMVNRLTVYVASDDNALLISHFINSSMPLGLPTQFSPDTQLDEAQSLLTIDSLDSHLDIIDATYIIKPEFFKHNYYRSRALITDMYWLLNNPLPTEQRPLYRSKLNPNKNYWILPP